MIASIRRPRQTREPAWHAKFLEMLPVIRRLAWFSFRSLKPEARHDAVQEVVANCLVAFVRLVQLRKVDLAYPTPLARYAIARVRQGRRVGTGPQVRDLLSNYAQMKNRFTVESLDHFDPVANEWREVLAEDRRATPADIAAIRIDFENWLWTLSRQRRRIATTLAGGESTSIVARRFRISPGRVSQIRRELHNKWNAFHGEPVLA